MVSYTQNLSRFDYKNADISQKRVLLRSVLNVAADEEGKVTDATRLHESLPVIIDIAKKAKTLVIMGHLGRPEKKERKFSLWHVHELLQKEIEAEGLTVALIEDLSQESIDRINQNDARTTIFLLENIRFFPGEESKDETERAVLVNQLTAIADVFVNDAFADYRQSVSTYYIAQHLDSYIGTAMINEIQSLGYFNAPEKPFTAVLGGAKLSEKLDALLALVKIADTVIIGGAMAYTLLKAKGIPIGNSLFEQDKLSVAEEIISNYGDKLLLPIDHLVAQSFDKNSPTEAIQEQSVPDNKIAIDIGEKTIQLFIEALQNAKSILWNGPMGVFEWSQSEKGTVSILEAISKNQTAYTLAGGGDSIAAINKFGYSEFDHVSTGGGAMLAFIAYEKFPILDVILGK